MNQLEARESVRTSNPETQTIRRKDIEKLRGRTNDESSKSFLEGLCTTLNGLSKGDRRWTITISTLDAKHNRGSETFWYAGHPIFHLNIPKSGGVWVLTQTRYLATLKKARINVTPSSSHGDPKLRIPATLESIERASRAIMNALTSLDEARARAMMDRASARDLARAKGRFEEARAHALPQLSDALKENIKGLLVEGFSTWEISQAIRRQVTEPWKEKVMLTSLKRYDVPLNKLSPRARDLYEQAMKAIQKEAFTP